MPDQNPDTRAPPTSWRDDEVRDQWHKEEQREALAWLMVFSLFALLGALAFALMRR
ncbi:MAG TPA: hypothetical protein VFF73_14880 [Planctomycetota bacterium]|nr:hypothetical protein [Planctomycetota bacterium]